ncbi:MAG TPA: EamA family transporter [Ignavibacteriaceae bacterium]|jgi:drug/metabolite transporter (DMT)-like permease|nr:EamA family transporter [Ignavibacteriaceae bacterium]
MDKDNFKAYIAWIVVCIIWGTTYLAIRIGVEHIPPMLFAGIRWIVAGSIFISLLKFLGKPFPPKNDLIHIAIMGTAMLGFGNGLVVVGEQYISSGLAALLITTVPFWVVGMESFLSKGPKINAKIILGLFVGLVGISLIFGSNWKDLFDTKYLIGILSIFGAVVSWSFGTVYSKYKRVNTHPLISASIQMLIAGVAQTILGILLGELSQISFNASGISALVYLIIAGSIFGYGSYIYAIEHLPLSLVSTYAYINPIIAVFLGWLFLDEKLNLIIGIGAVIIILGVILVKQGTKKVSSPL